MTLFGGWKRIGEIFRYAGGSSRVEIEQVIRDKGANHRWVDFARVGYRVEVQILLHHARCVRKQNLMRSFLRDEALLIQHCRAAEFQSPLEMAMLNRGKVLIAGMP